MKRIIGLYRIFNVLSLDVAVGATASSFFLAEIFEVPTTPQVFICLGLTVWLIYTADHLLDAKLIVNEAATRRHQFHQKHFKMILVFAIVIAATIIPLLFFIQSNVFIWGLRLLFMVLVYFFIQRRFRLLKEFLGASLYCMGIMLPVIALYQISIYSLISLPSILFFNTALINLILFSWFDRDKDLAHNHSSLTTTLGSDKVMYLLCVLFGGQMLLIITIYIVNPMPYLIVYFLMCLGLLFVFLRARWFTYNDRYRLAGDAVFIIPLIYQML